MRLLTEIIAHLIKCAQREDCPRVRVLLQINGQIRLHISKD